MKSGLFFLQYGVSQKLKKFVSVLFVLFFVSSFSTLFAAEEKSVITIVHAQKSEYKKDQVNGGDCIILTGDVQISVAKGSSTTVINANSVNYNRGTEMIYAEGDVSLEQKGGSGGGETITASSLLFNTSTLEGVFDNGRAVQASSDAINLPSGSKLVVASDVFGRDSGGTIAFKTGELTFCDEDDPHWRIKATRIWLLPGGEFAFLNAILYVGHVPLLWLPAFYYPKDELLFNPAFGYKKREGYFINTTTYLYGRKPADAKSTAELKSSSSSDKDDKIDFFSFMNTGAMKEQVREGLVLHNLDEDFKGDTSSYFKIMADYYANLGAMVGFDGAFKPGNYITNLETKLQLGFSNTIFKNDTEYMTKNSQGDVISDKSNFMGIEMPFRYQTKLKLSLAKPFSLSLDMPIYSDPYFDYDFNNRAETMDWIDFAMSGDGKNEDTTVSEVTSFSWNLNGNHTFKVPEAINPFVSSLAISSFNSAVTFSSRSNQKLAERSEYKDDKNWSTYTPERSFYYPSQITPFKISTRVSGTLVKIPATKKSASSPANLTLSLPEELDLDKKAKQENPEGAEAEKKSEAVAENAEKSEEIEEEPVLDEKYLPKIAAPGFSTKNLNGISYDLTYSVTPDFTSELSYSAENLNQPEDFRWDDIRSAYIQLRAPTTLTSRVGYRDSFLSLTDTFNFNPVYQSHPYLKSAVETVDANNSVIEDTSNGGYSKNSRKSYKKADYAARKMDVTDTNTLTFKPFYLTEHFSDTSLTWNTTLKLLELKFDSTYYDQNQEAKWEYLTADLTDEELFTTHNLNLVLAANEFDRKLTQQLSLTTTLPPQVDRYSGTLSLGFFNYLNLSASTGIKQKSKGDNTWVKEDFNQSASLRLFDGKLNASQSYTYNLEESQTNSLRFSLSGYGLRLEKSWSYTTGYSFNEGSGWKSNTDKEFQPYQLSLAYSSSSKSFKRWNDRISFAPSLSTSVVYDYLRPTNSYFRFIPAATFKINNFLNITFSAETKNSQIYQYFGSDTQLYYKKDKVNVISDLMDSFRFDDESKRKNSAFKIQTLKIDVTHELDDWDLNCSFSIKPRYISSGMKEYSGHTSPFYDFSPYFTISVSWRPLASMKTEIVDEYGEWKLNP
ncbi:MAG: LPS-assembly protein LptD [Treponema sp.]|nr:LPS-assembly protein LptD [Candidatus Treponema equifaecale]